MVHILLKPVLPVREGLEPAFRGSGSYLLENPFSILIPLAYLVTGGSRNLNAIAGCSNVHDPEIDPKIRFCLILRIFGYFDRDR